MYKVSIVRESHSFDDNMKDVYTTEEIFNFDGCIQFRISESGVVSADFYDGRAEVYKMYEGERVTRLPMTDEEILATEGLGDWYREQIELAQYQAAAEAGEASATDTPQ